jgi:hypothetical protein
MSTSSLLELDLLLSESYAIISNTSFKSAVRGYPFDVQAGNLKVSNSFGTRSRYRKKLSAAAANQIAGNQKISLGMHK